MPRSKTVTDDAVMDAALRLVERGGPAGLTFAAVGREVGLAPATVIQRFGSKKGLLLAVAGREAGSGGEAIRLAAARHRSPLRALTAGLLRMSSSVGSPEAMANHLAFLQMDLSDPDFHRLALAHAEAVRAEIEALLDAAVGAGEIAATDTARLAQTVQSTYNGAMITWGLFRRGSLESWLRRELDTLLSPRRAA